VSELLGGIVETLSKWVLRHRLMVVLGWLIITAIGVVIAPSVSGRLVSGNHISGPAYTANLQIAKQYGGATSDPGVLVLGFPAGATASTPRVRSELAAVDAGIAKTLPSLRVVSYAATHDRALIGTGGRSTVVLAYPPHDGDDIAPPQVDALIKLAHAAAPDLTVNGTSVVALEAGNTTNTGNSSVLTEVLIGGALALVVLALVFGSFIAFLPLLMALVSVLTMQLLIYGLTYILPASSPINPAVQFIVALLGLGLSIDYSLLVVTRWREERAAGRHKEKGGGDAPTGRRDAPQCAGPAIRSGSAAWSPRWGCSP
jgi:putative drug exporter of the RND superfamily